MSLFVALKEVLNEGVIAHIAQENNEKPEKISKALDAFSASFVGGMLKRVTNEAGMNLLYNHVQKIEFSAQNLEKSIKDPAQYDAIKAVGEKYLNTMLPGLKSPVSLMVAKYAATRNSLASSLAGPMVAIIMSVLKKTIADKQLDAEGFTAYLGDQREHLLNVVPEIDDVLVETVGIRSLLQNFTVPKAERPVSIAKTSVDKSPEPFLGDSDAHPEDSPNYLKWLGAAVVVIGLAAAGWYFWQQQSSQTVAESTTVEEENSPETPQNVSPTATDTLTTTPPAKDSVAAVKPATTGNPMETYLADAATTAGKVFKFDNVDFVDNTTQLKPEATAPVKTLAELLKKYPNAQVKLVGFANDAKAPVTNKVLSTKRVFAIKDELIKAGINYLRVDAEGRGTGVSPKDSTRKQKPLREIYVRFVKK
jgi:outer membrane protein OmpA-like peptidoglycan-associated protein